MRFEALLIDEIKAELEELKKMELGTETYKNTIDGVSKLIDRAIEIEKIQSEQEERSNNHNTDYNFKVEQTKKENTIRLVENGINVAGIIIPVIVTIWGVEKSFEFEREGTVTTIMGRGFVQRLLGKK